MMSNPIEKDTDDDGYNDKEEMENGTRFILQAGNLVTNFKYSYVNDYRKALILYIQQYTGATYQDKLINAIKDTYNSSLFSMLETGTNYALSFSDILNEMKLNGKFAEATGKLVNKLPSPVVKFINKMGSGKLSTFLTYGVIALDTGVSVLDTVSIYGGLDAGFMQCAEVDEFLESIIENSDIKEMREAATDVKEMLEDDFKKMLNEAIAVAEDVLNGGANILVTYALTHLGPIGWAVYLGWGLGNLAFGTGQIL